MGRYCREWHPTDHVLPGGIGPGGRGRSVLNGMLGEPDVRFLAICDLNRSRREMVKNMIDVTNHQDVGR
jgi:hypothetical protein